MTGELIELRNGRYVVTSRSHEFATGRLQMHRDGYGFVIPDHPLETCAAICSFRRPPPEKRCTATA